VDIAKTFQDWRALLDHLDVNPFLEEFQNESDRAAAVLGAVYDGGQAGLAFVPARLPPAKQS